MEIGFFCRSADARYPLLGSVVLGRAGQHHSRPQRLKPTTGAGRAKTRPQHGRCSGRVASVASIAMRGSVQRRSRSEQISVASTRFSSMLATTSGRRAGFSRSASGPHGSERLQRNLFHVHRSQLCNVTTRQLIVVAEHLDLTELGLCRPNAVRLDSTAQSLEEAQSSTTTRTAAFLSAPL